jgi:hypothetical protein
MRGWTDGEGTEGQWERRTGQGKTWSPTDVAVGSIGEGTQRGRWEGPCFPGPWGTHLCSVVVCSAPPRRLHRQHSYRTASSENAATPT